MGFSPSSTSSSKEFIMKIQDIAYRSLIFYTSIFLLMIVFESQRFSVFFERESNRIPQLSIASEYVEKVSDITGVSFVTQRVSQLSKDFSQAYIIDDTEPFGKQFMGFISQYTHYDYSQALAWGTHSATARTNTNGTGDGSLSPESLASTAQGNNADEAKTRGKDGEALSVSSAAVDDKMAEDAFISAALLDKNMTVAMLVKQKQEGILKKYARGYMKTFPMGKKTFYYNPRNSSPAPSRLALREYKSVLPDYGKRIKVLIVGDSMMLEGLGPALHSSLRKKPDLSIVREGHYSSGLSRPDFYNWPQSLTKLVEKHKPQLIVVSMGANDTQDIVINTNRHFIDTDSWKRVYEIRTYNYLNIAAAEERQVLWISLPIMGREPYFTRTKRISKIQAEVSSYFNNVTYVNIEHLLTKNDKFISFMQGKNNKSIRLRKRDNIHVSQKGGEILTSYLLPRVQDRIDSIRYNEVRKTLMPPIAGQANHVTFSSELRKKETEYVIYLPKGLRKNKTEKEKLEGNNYPINNSPNNSLGSASSNLVDNLGSDARGKPSEQAPSMPALIQKNMKSGDERFPVLYLLHGAASSAKAWNQAMGKELQEIANEKRVIIVAPFGEAFGWYVDSPLVAQNQIESYVVKELVPHIDMLYPTNKKRAIAGLSMGGHGAMLLGFKYPKIFSSVASASGALDIRLHPEQWKIKDLLGNLAENKNEWDKNSVVAHIGKKRKNSAPKQILIVTGTEDALVLEDNRLAEKILKERKYIFEYNEMPGNHDWNFWRKYIPNQLRKQADYLHGINK